MKATRTDLHPREEALSSPQRARPGLFRRGVLWLTLSAMIAQPVGVSAQVISAVGAGAYQPQVGAAANGVTVVQITAPSAAGVSRNQYQQYSVTPQGVVLNNSQVAALTQQAGYIAGNPNLAAGTARVILNEVVSNLPSNLRGYTEVGGTKAEVIIANPNGITCDGCGFINTSRGVLTTGTPVFGANGSLDAFRVAGGSIAINGAGLNAGNTDQIDLIARAVQVNAELWGKNLNVVTGANQIAYADLATQTIAGSGATPTVSIDVALLGGMYANSIRLVGTEAGVGVANAGKIVAQVGDLILTSAGRLVLATTSSLASARNIDLAVSGGLQNSGVINAPQNLSINTPADVTNTGILSASNLSITAGPRIANDGGTLEGTGSIALAADSISNRSGSIKNTGTGDINLVSTGAIDNTGGYLGGNGALNICAASFDNSSGITYAGTRLGVTTSGTLVNTSGLLVAGQNLVIDSASLTGDGSVLSTGDLSVKLVQDYTHTGQLQADGSATLETAGTLTNLGTLQAGTAVKLKAATIDNRATGQIRATDANLQANDITNRGLIDGQNTVVEGVTVSNLGTGRIYGDQVAIGAATVINADENGVAPVIAARNRLDIGASTLNNSNGALIYSAGDMLIGGSLNQQKQAQGQAAVINNSSAVIEADGDLILSAAQVNNRRTQFTVTQTDGEPTAVHEALAFNTGGPWALFKVALATPSDTVVNVDSGAGRILSGGNMAFNGAINNDKSDIMAGGNITLNMASYTGTSQQGQTLKSEKGLTINCISCANGKTDTSEAALFQHDMDSLRSVFTLSLLKTWAATGYSFAALNSMVQVGVDPDTGAPVYGSPVSLLDPRLQGSVNPYASSGSVLANYDLAPARLTANQAITGTATQISNLNLGGGVGQAAATAQAGTGSAGSNSANPQLPTSSLYTLHPGTTGGYLIETDPRFANYRTWLSSDYMLKSLGFDPSLIEKRLGDGFYEQKLIREQVSQLTGQRFLAGYSNDEAQYQALLEQGAVFAKAYQLTPGVALTAAQMAALTSDIVWLVEKNVTLPDGTQSRVLVPQLYARVQEGGLSSSGALIAANNIDLQVAGDLTNAGTIAARSALSLKSNNLNNLSGRVTGDQIDLQAATDLNNIGGEIRAASSLAVQAGRDINIVSTTVDYQESSGSIYQKRSTTVDRIAGLYVDKPGGTLAANAGRDLNLVAAQVDSAGSAALQAGNNVNLGTLATSDLRNFDLDADNYSHLQHRSETGSRLSAQGDLSLTAGANLSVRAADLKTSAGDIALTAGQNIQLVAGESATQSAEGSKDVSRSGLVSVSRQSAYQTEVLATRLTAGRDVLINAGAPGAPDGSGNLTVQGTALTAGNDLKIQTSGDLQLLAAMSQRSEFLQRSTQNTKKAETLNFELEQNRVLLSTLTAGNAIDLKVGGNLSAQTATRDASAQLQADRITADGIVKGSDRQQVSLTHTDDKAGTTTNGPTSKVLGNLAAQGIRSGANDSFSPEAIQTGQAAVTALMQTGLLSVKNQPGVQAALNAPTPNGSALTYKDDSGKVTLTLAGQAKVQAVYSQLKLTETFDVKHFPDQGMAQIVTLVAAIALTAMTGGAGAGTLGAALATAGSTSALMINAAVIAMASTMTGQLAGGASFDQAFQAGIKAGATSAITAGILDIKVIDTAQGMQSINPLANVQTTGANIVGKFSADTFAQNLGGMALRGVVNAGVNTAINGGSFGDAFKSSFISDLAAVGANAVGLSTNTLSPGNILGHAAVGALAAQLKGLDALSGAIGGAGGAIVNPILDQAIGGTDGSGWGKDPEFAQKMQTATLQLGSMAVSAVAATALGKNGMTAALAAQNETVNNFLTKENIVAKQARLALARTGQEREAIYYEYQQKSLANLKQAEGELIAGSVMQRTTLENVREGLTSLLATPLTPETRNQVTGSIREIDGLLSRNANRELAEPIILGVQALALLPAVRLLGAEVAGSLVTRTANPYESGIARIVTEGEVLTNPGTGAALNGVKGGATVADDIAAANATGKISEVSGGAKLYPDGSLRTSDGKFASVAGNPAPGTTSASNYADFLSQNGVNVVGKEMVVEGPLGPRRYDIVVRDTSGSLQGIEIKTGTAGKNSYQDFTDRFVNQFGAQGVGRIAGETVKSSITIYLP